MANAKDTIVTCLGRNWAMVESALESMDEEILARAPAADCNSPAWILWHMNRVMDSFVHTRVQNTEQLWVDDGWAGRFGMAPDAEDRGVGWTSEQVAAWTPPARDIQVGYYHAIKSSIQQYLEGSDEGELAREIVWQPVAEPRPIAACFGQVMWDYLSHGGQIAYLRGLYLGMGWHRHR